MTKRSGSSRRKRAKERAAAAAAAAVAYPPWVLLGHHGVKVEGSSSYIADMNTLATSRTAAAIPIGIALCVAAPPEASRVCAKIQPPDGVSVQYSIVLALAAHSDCILIQTVYKETGKNERVDYFVYNAGNAAADPPRQPSLLLLPPFYPTEEETKGYYSLGSRGPIPRFLNSDCTGLLRRGDDELVVAELKMVEVSEDTSSSWKAAEFVLFRSGEWSVKRLPISCGGAEGTEREVPSSWTPRKVVPVGDRLLCWFDMLHGLIFSDVFNDELTLRYVPFPVESPYGFHVCITSGGDSVKLVNTFPRCCCGGEGASKCRRSLHAYTIRTWMLRMDDMTWVMDGVVDATELWALDAYQGLPRVELSHPVVSLDDPNAITFVVCEAYLGIPGDWTVWLVTVDMRRKSISSVFSYPPEQGYHIRLSIPMPSKVSDYLNSYPSRSNGGTGTSSPSKIHMGTAAPPPTAVDKDAINSSAPSFYSFSVEPAVEQASKEVSLEKKILMVLEEIPELARDEMLKAYSILIYDNGRRFRSLLELPMNLRKDWLLIEIKASEACSTCSACTKDMQHA